MSQRSSSQDLCIVIIQKDDFPPTYLPKQTFDSIQYQGFRKQMIPNQTGPFRQLLERLDNNHVYLEALAQGDKNYTIRPYNIDKLTPIKVAELFDMIQKKFYTTPSQNSDSLWVQNELRIYIWFLVGYAFLQKKDIKHMGESDWEYFSQIFNNRDLDFFEFQAKCLIKNQNKVTKWTPEQVEMLLFIIDSKEAKKKWNQVAKELFIISKKAYFRTGKQCRERWLNHLDPVKVRTPWARLQDQILMNFVLEHGKKWSHIVKALGGTRTQHMVKNRFKSLYNFQAKRHPQKRQNQVIKSICFKLESNIAIKEVKGRSKQKKNISQRPKCELDFFEVRTNEKGCESSIEYSNNINSKLVGTVEQKKCQSMTEVQAISKEPFGEEEPSRSPSISWNYPRKNSNNFLHGNFLNNDRWELQLNFDYGLNQGMPNFSIDDQNQLPK